MGESLSINVSIGVVTSPSAEDELDGADDQGRPRALQGQGQRQGQAQLFHDEMDTAYRYRQRLKAELKARGRQPTG